MPRLVTLLLIAVAMLVLAAGVQAQPILGTGCPAAPPVVGPFVVKPGTVSSQPVCSIDLFPTILSATKTPLPTDRDIDGLSLIGHLQSAGNQPLDRDELFWHFPHYRHAPGPYSIIRKDDHKLIKFYDGPMELYDLENDLGEQHDLATKLPERVKELDSILRRALNTMGAKIPRDNPAFSP